VKHTALVGIEPEPKIYGMKTGKFVVVNFFQF